MRNTWNILCNLSIYIAAKVMKTSDATPHLL